MLKNAVQAMLLDEVVTLGKSQRSALWGGRASAREILSDKKLSEVILSAVQMQVELLRNVQASKKELYQRKPLRYQNTLDQRGTTRNSA